ncbi:hypothetical protein ABW20_dc0103461 [Dactylellina cionopaga]|nr:hypothetical protein ABW20_dc0103461 [Dactylellina cionopaga]
MSFEKDGSFCVPLWINGAALCPEDSPRYDVTTPPAQSLAWSACAATPSTAEKAISSASQAFPSWSKTPIESRISIFSKAARLLEAKFSEAQYYVDKEIGTGMAWGAFNQNVTMNALSSVKDILTDVLRPENVDGRDGTNATVRRVPYGVMAAIAPWSI